MDSIQFWIGLIGPIRFWTRLIGLIRFWAKLINPIWFWTGFIGPILDRTYRFDFGSDLLVRSGPEFCKLTLMHCKSWSGLFNF